LRSRLRFDSNTGRCIHCAHIDPAKYDGLSEGDAHVIHNTEGRASDDSIRSPVISRKVLGTLEFLVIHPTDWRMKFFIHEVIRVLLASGLGTGELRSDGFHDMAKGLGSRAGEFTEWLTFADPRQVDVDDVTRTRNPPPAPKAIPISGCVYDVKSRRLIDVQRAMQAGKVAQPAS
jgi:carbonic anhydrase